MKAGASAGRSGSAGTALRRLALAALAVYALAYFGSYLHLDTVPHVRCSEHGELIHLGAAGLPHAALRPDAAASQARSNGRGATEPLAAGHEHCAVGSHLASRHLSVQPAPQALGLAPLTGAPVPFASTQQGLPRQISLRFVAPTHSPPV